MKTLRQKVFWSTIATFMLLTATFLVLSYFSEPRYHGRRLTQWLMEYHIRTHQGLRRDATAAEEALRAIGTNAMPTLAKMLLPQERSFSVTRLLEAAKIMRAQK